MDDIYKSIEEYKPNEKRKILIAFDHMVPDMFNIEKLNPIVTELFTRRGKLTVSHVFITQSYLWYQKMLD